MENTYKIITLIWLITLTVITLYSFWPSNIHFAREGELEDFRNCARNGGRIYYKGEAYNGKINIACTETNIQWVQSITFTKKQNCFDFDYSALTPEGLRNIKVLESQYCN